MTEREAIQQMRAQVGRARQLAAEGNLSRYMRGYIEGKIDAYANVAGTDTAYELQRELDKELLEIWSSRDAPGAEF